MSTERIVVDASVADAFVAKLKQKAMTMTAGDPRLGDFVLGSIVSREAAERMNSLVKDAVAKGATLLAGGRRQRDHHGGDRIGPRHLGHADLR